ncbi:MAG: hypothetical protein R2792_06345 [Saprospiraceae bacterium]
MYGLLYQRFELKMSIWEQLHWWAKAFGQVFTSYAEGAYRFLIPVLFVLGGTLLLLMLIQLLFFTRWRKIRVFISYKHLYMPIANELKTFFEQKNKAFKVEMLPFETRTHDDTVATVRGMIRRADIMVCIPDPEAPSFVNAEILAMSVLNKPIVLVRHHKDQLLPHTALSGYPVLELATLRQFKFVPLANYALFICRHYTDLKRLLNRLVVGLAFFELLNEYKWHLLVVLAAILSGFAGWVAFKAFLAALLVLTMTITAIFIIIGYTVDWRASKIARQEMLSGNTTFEKLDEALSEMDSDWHIAECLDKKALPSKV